MQAEAGLEGSVAAVTGALGNLGPVWVEALAGAGAAVAAIDLAGEEPPPHAALLETADVTDRGALESARNRIERELGPVSILVNGAGIDQPPRQGGEARRFEDVPLEDFRRTVDVNLAGTVNACQVFGSRMVGARAGSIVNIGSLYATIAPDPTFYDHIEGFLKPAAYGASKAGVVNFTRYLARLWGPHGVRVNVLSPGGVIGGQDPEFLRKYCARVPLGRMADPEDLAGPLLFLAGASSRYLTGHELRVDGGFTA